MTMQEVIENELKCVQRDCCRLENECAKCDLVLPKEEIINAYNKALKLEKENAELKSLKDVADLIRLNNSSVIAMAQLNNNNVALRKENAELKAKLTHAKTIIKDLLDNSDEYARQRAIEFLEGKE